MTQQANWPTEQDTPPGHISAAELEIGLLKIPQVAALMPFGRNDGDTCFLVQRLIARESLAAVQVGDNGEWRVSVDAIKLFLAGGDELKAKVRAAHGLPPETLAPRFPVSGASFDGIQWAFDMGAMLNDLTNEIAKQIPSIYDGKGDFNLTVASTPAIQAIITRPVPPVTIIQPADASAFRNMGEIYLARLLQGKVSAELYANADSQNIGSSEIQKLYKSPAQYVDVVNAAGVAFASSSLRTSKIFPPLDVLRDQSRFFNVALPTREIMRLAGTDFARLACLAF